MSLGRTAGTKERDLQLTWLGHSCMRIENDGFVTVVDAGLVSDADALNDADAVLITHEHPDHYNPDRIAAAVAARPGLPIWTNKSVAGLISGSISGAKVHTVGNGDAFTLGGIDVQVHGEWHAEIHPDVPRVRNVGFLFNNSLFHPGDALTDPHAPVDLLLAPEFGAYTKLGNTIDFIRQVKPQRVSPVHDSGLDPTGLAGVDGFLVGEKTAPFAPGTGAPFTRMIRDQPFDL
jgi:L-ascorbate metabolism protein UlaG (beta-lactamase superfamily)